MPLSALVIADRSQRAEFLRAKRELERELRGVALVQEYELLGRFVGVVDHELTWQGLSDDLCGLLGYHRRALLGQPVVDVVADDVVKIRREVGELRRNGSVAGVATLRARDGALIPYRYSTRAIHGGELYVCVGELLPLTSSFFWLPVEEEEGATRYLPVDLDEPVYEPPQQRSYEAAELMTREEAAKALTVSPATVDRLGKNGKLVKVQVSPGRVGILRRSVEELIRRGGPFTTFLIVLAALALLALACGHRCGFHGLLRRFGVSPAVHRHALGPQPWGAAVTARVSGARPGRLGAAPTARVATRANTASRYPPPARLFSGAAPRGARSRASRRARRPRTRRAACRAPRGAQSCRQVQIATCPPGWLNTSSPALNPAGHCDAPAGPVAPVSPFGPAGPAGPAGPGAPLATLIVTVLAGAAAPVPSAVEARKPEPAASAIAAARSRNGLAARRILTAALPDLDPLVERPVVVGEPLVAVGLGAALLPADVPGRAQHGADPGEERAERGDLVGRHITAPRRAPARRRSGGGAARAAPGPWARAGRRTGSRATSPRAPATPAAARRRRGGHSPGYLTSA